MVSQTNGIAQGINFPFALVNTGFHYGKVFFPLTFLVDVFVKSIGVRIQDDALLLAVDYTSDQFLKFFVSFRQRQIRPNLGCTVAQPHGVNITRNDISVGFAINHFKLHRSVECIGETIFKQPGEFRVGNLFFELYNSRLYGCTAELAIG